MTTLEYPARLYRAGVDEIAAARAGALARVYAAPHQTGGFYPAAAWALANAGDPTTLTDRLDAALLAAEPPIPDEQRRDLMDAFFAGAAQPTYFGWVYTNREFNLAASSPAVLAQEAILARQPPDWSVGGLTDIAFPNDIRATFRVQPGKMFVVGVTQSLSAAAPGALFHGFFCAGDVVHAIRRTEASTTVYAGTTAASRYGAPAELPLYEVRKRNHVVSYLIDGVALASYTLTSAEDPDGEFRLNAVIFEPGTWVEAVSIEGYFGAVGQFPQLRGRAGNGAVLAGAAAWLPQLAGAARAFGGGATSFPHLTGAAREGALGGAVAALPRLGGVAASYAYPTMSGRSAGRLPAVAGAAAGKGGAAGRSTGALPGLAARGAKLGRNASAGSFRTLASSSFGLSGAEAYIHSHSFLGPTFSAPVLLAVSMSSVVDVLAEMATRAVLDGGVSSSAAASTPSVLQAVVAAVIRSTVLAGTAAPLFGQDAEVWAVNLANAASSIYEGYAFNSFATVGGLSFGAREGGIYLLEGSTDNGLPIQASVSYGKQDFGTKTNKNMVSAYVGASSTGKLILKVVAEGEEYLYAARSSSDDIQQQRFDVGRGLKGNYFTFELFNKNGCEFEIDSVTFVAADFKRRI